MSARSNNTNTNENNKMYQRDWRKALGSSQQPAYRVGNTTFRFHMHFALVAVCIGSLLLIFLIIKPDSVSSYSPERNYLAKSATVPFAYNYTYPLSAPIKSNGMITYRIGLIADLDQMSRKIDAKNTWCSYYKKGYISYNADRKSIAVSFDMEMPTELSNQYALNGRGMELSELLTFNGRLLTFDDRTGIVFEMMDNNNVVPWVVLMDGDGRSTKGFKSEWATMKDEMLYVGSMGKEWTSATGEFQSYDPMYVKAISTTGNVSIISYFFNGRSRNKWFFLHRSTT